MKILLAHAFYRQPGGEDAYVMRLRELLGGHHDVRLFAGRNEELTPSLRTGMSMIYSRRTRQHVEHAIREFAPDIVHLHNAYPALGPAVQVAVQKLKVPLVMTVHNHRLRCPNGLMFTEGQVCRRCQQGFYLSAVLHRCFPDRRQSAAYATALWLHRFVLRVQDGVRMFIAPSRFMRERLTLWGIPRERTTTIANPVDPIDVASPPGTFGVYVGRLSSEKGVDVLLRALARAGDPPFKVVGDGPLRHAMERLADDLGLQRTDFTGRLPGPDVQRIIDGCQYLVMSSISEEVGPLAPLEAMARGRPIIVSALGALSELAQDGAGFAVRPGDAAALAATIRRLVDEPELAAKSGKQAWRLCTERYSTEVHLQRLDDAYASVVTP
jgi:glycosyltransferase involved in cell wall biosynthesis